MEKIFIRIVMKYKSILLNFDLSERYMGLRELKNGLDLDIRLALTAPEWNLNDLLYFNLLTNLLSQCKEDIDIKSK